MMPRQSRDRITMSRFKMKLPDTIALQLFWKQSSPSGTEAEIRPIKAEFDANFP